jgi:hypothetical protein
MNTMLHIIVGPILPIKRIDEVLPTQYLQTPLASLETPQPKTADEPSLVEDEVLVVGRRPLI